MRVGVSVVVHIVFFFCFFSPCFFVFLRMNGDKGDRDRGIGYR